MNSLLKKPSAWIPIVMPLGILAMILITILLRGVTYSEDEGIEAHIFQLWLVIEFLAILFFAVKYLPREPKSALIVLAIQVFVSLAACFPVFYFGF